MRIKFKKILCAVDFSDHSNRVLSYGKALAAEFNAEICLCHVISLGYLVYGHIPPHEDHTGMEVHRMEQATKSLESLSKEFDMSCEIKVCTGHPAEEIARIAKEDNIDIVLAATHGGSGVKRFLLGSVTERLVKILSCPFLVLDPKKENQDLVQNGIHLKRILIGCDFSPDSSLAVEYAQSLAQEFQAQLFLGHVIPTVEYFGAGTTEYLNAQEEFFTGWHDAYQGRRQSIIDLIEKKLLNLVGKGSQDWCSHEIVVLEGKPYQELLKYAEKNKIDMIVLGARGHSLLEEFIIGSTADRIISRSPCPVMAIRQPEEEIVEEAEKTFEEKEMSIEHVQVKHIMERSVISVKLETDIKEAARLLWENHINGMPVVNSEGELEGILCQTDLIFAQRDVVFQSNTGFNGIGALSLLGRSRDQVDDSNASLVEQVMEKHVIWVSPETSIAELTDLMVERHFHTIPVLEDNKVIGIVGKEDLLKLLITKKV